MPKASTFGALAASQVVESDSFPLITNAGENKRVAVTEMRQVVGPGWSLTINAALETGLTDELKIQAAVDRAVSVGAQRVFIPTSMLPYDASLITFDDTVQMVREGGSFDRGDVQAYGAHGDGSTDDTASIAATDAAVVANITVAGGPGRVYFSNGTYKLSSNLTIASEVEFEPGVGLVRDPGVTLTFNGHIHGDPTQKLFYGTGTTVIASARNPRIRSSWFLGTDVGDQINKAAASIGYGPGTIVIGNRLTDFATTIDLTDSQGLVLTSEDGNLNMITDYVPMNWTGGAGSGSALKAPGAIALEISYLNISYSSAVYDGYLVSLSSTGGAQNTSTVHLHHCRLSGTATANLAAGLIELNTTLDAMFDNVTLDEAVCGVKATGGSNNVVVFGAGVWFDKHFSDCAIKMWGNAWTMGPLVHECDPAGGVPLSPLFKLAGDSGGIVFSGSLSLDGGNGGGTIIDLDTGGFVASGVDINMVIAHGSGTAIRLSDTAGESHGVNIHGCRIDGLATGVHLGRANGIHMTGNRLSCTVPWTGTAPTRAWVAGNDLGSGTASAGVAVANDADIALSPPGSAHDAAGKVFIWEHVGGNHGVYNLNGGGGTVTEMEDGGAVFTATFNNAGTTNIYWDGGTSSYRLQNKCGAARTYTVNYVGR